MLINFKQFLSIFAGVMDTAQRTVDTLFRLHYKPLCMFALHYLEDIEAAEDAVQEVFIKFWESGAEAASGKSYLYTMTRNRCIDVLRRSGREVPLSGGDALSDEQISERSELEARLWEAVGRLPKRRRELLLMSKRDGLKYEEIAARTGLSVNTVHNQISRALKSLRGDSDEILPMVLFTGLCVLMVKRNLYERRYS